jgi:4-amino-4-deoxy-L-arabinose transferase-like glycosyltransferase
MLQSAIRAMGTRELAWHDAALARLPASPGRMVALFVAVQVVAWTVFPWIVSTAPPLDVVEGLVWGREWLLGTFKHPPLPSWLIEVSMRATGSPIFGPYLASQACMAVAYLFVYLTGRRVTTSFNAAVATLLLAGTFYVTWPTPELNHNVVQMPIWAALIYCLATVRGAPGNAWPWLAMGLVAGIGVYAKYSVAVLYVVAAGWILYERRLRAALVTPWPGAGAALAVLVALPHLVWLFASDLEPFAYASERASDRSWTGGTAWLVTQMAVHLPMALLLGAIGVKTVRALAPAAASRDDLAFIATMTLGPALLTALGATALQAGVRDMWGMPMFTTSGLLLVLLLGRSWDVSTARRALLSAMVLVVGIAVAFAIVVEIGKLTGRPKRNAWPMAELAAKAEAAWHAETQAPLKFVAGDKWLAGLVMAGGTADPRVVYDGRLDLSPWLTAEDLAAGGVLYLWAGEQPPAGLLSESVPLARRGTFALEEAREGSRAIGYAVQLPR